MRIRIDSDREEAIRIWPVGVARLMNRFVRWTNESCVGGCGYPTTHRFVYELETIGKTRVVMALCSLGGECERRVERDPRDEDGRSYADFRPDLIAALAEHPETDVIRLTFTLS